MHQRIQDVTGLMAQIPSDHERFHMMEEHNPISQSFYVFYILFGRLFDPIAFRAPRQSSSDPPNSIEGINKALGCTLLIIPLRPAMLQPQFGRPLATNNSFHGRQ